MTRIQKKTKVNGFPIERWPLSELKRAPQNPRRMPTDQAIALQRSLEEFGIVEPIVVNRTTGHVVGGHQRLDALEAINITHTDVVIVELDEQREKTLNLALNKIHGEWDSYQLAEILRELQMHDVDMALTGFDTGMINRLVSGPLEVGSNDINAEYVGMPEFDQQDHEAFRTISVHFKDQEAVDQFSRLIGQNFTPKTKVIWYPQVEIKRTTDIRY